MEPDELPDWERLLAAERHLQSLVPALEDLRPRFDAVLAALEAAAGWQTARVQRPVAILGQLDGIMTGIRQLRRTEALESEVVAGLRVPTLAEMARIKAWLLATSARTWHLTGRIGRCGERQAQPHRTIRSCCGSLPARLTQQHRAAAECLGAQATSRRVYTHAAS